MTEKLVSLQDISRLSSRVIRILGQNPGKYTLQGTNTYLVSAPSSQFNKDKPAPAILIDTGEGIDSYTPLLEKVLRGDEPPNAGPKFISDIILTHRHGDHIGGLVKVLELCSRLRKEFPLSSPPPRIRKFPDDSDSDLLKLLENEKVPFSHYTPYKITKSREGTLFPLADGDRIFVPPGEGESSKAGGSEDKEEGSTFKVIHTPGHSSDHVCLLLEQEKSLVTADHVLGQGSSVFDDLANYIRSLKKCSRALEEIGPSAQQEWNSIDLAKENENILYPSHGPTLEYGRKTLKNYVHHRLEREAQVLELLAKPSPTGKTSPGDGTPTWTILEIVQNLYSSYPEHLYPAAARGIFLHLQKLATPDPEQQNSVKVQLLDSPSYSKVGKGQFPEVPSNPSEFAEAMEIRFALVRGSQEGQGGGRL